MPVQRSLQRQNASEQTACYLRKCIREGQFAGALPGVEALAAVCDVSPVTMRAALRQLEEDGTLLPATAGKPRQISESTSADAGASRALRIMILPGERIEDEDGTFQQTVTQLRARLESAGHVCTVTARSQSQMGYDPRAVRKYLQGFSPDAWIIIGGGRDTLEWLATLPVPVMGIGGNCAGLPISSTGMDTAPPFREGVRRLVDLGHRRIVFLAPAFLRGAGASPCAGILTEELASCGVYASDYNFPNWEETPAGLVRVLHGCFQVTPPTALIVTYSSWVAGVLSFMASRNLRVPEHVSLLCLGSDHWMSWHRPEVARMCGDDSAMIRQILHWSQAIARGQTQQRHQRFPLNLIEGGSVGPPPLSRIRAARLLSRAGTVRRK